MALKNLFDMVKADRYTADGREAIIKAQEEETEDKVYQIGEISQKTGLQKTANGWVKPKNGKQPGAKKQNAPTGSKKIDYQVTEKGGKFYATGHQFSDGSQLHAGPFGSEKELHEFMNGSPYKSTAESKPAAQEEIGKFYTKFKDAQSAYDAGRQTFTDGGYKIYNTPQGYKVVDDPKIQQRMEAAGYEIEADVPEGTKPPKGPGEKPATPRREAVSAGRMMKDLDGNFWSRPEDFKEDITSRGWDVDEMTNEYAVISNEAGSQYEVRFDDHSDEGDLTVRNFKALQIDEDDDDDSLEDAAPSLSEIVDRVYNIGEISEKTGLQKTAQGWKPPKETKFGKVQQKNGEWGVQTKTGKGSSFIKHKDEADAKRALANYTAGYNRAGRNKEDPHSDKARQIKHWNKETDQIAKKYREERRAAHAAQFQNPAGKALSRADKEAAIRKDLGLTEGEDMSRFSDEQIEKMYAKTQQTPEQQKADFDKSKIGQAVNKGRQEFAAEKTRQKELASKTNAIGLPKENKPALSQTDGKGNKVEIKITESKGGGFYVDKYVNGKKVGINNANTRESAEAKAKSMMEQHMADPDYKAESKPENKPKVPSSDDLDWAKGVASRNNVKAEDLIKNGTALKPGIKVSFNTPRDGDLSGEIIDIAGYDGKAFVTVSTPKGNRTIATEKVVTDSAPRVLTGDCRIRIRKEKPALTGDTKIRVRK